MAFYRVCGNYYGTDNDVNSLKHYRTPGSKNGVRKYQYEDGTLTPAGRIHYGVGKGGAAKSATAYTDTGTKGDPNGAAGLAYKVGGGKGLAAYNNVSYRVGNAAKAVGKTASSMARDAGNWGKQAGKDIGKAVGDAKTWVGDRSSDVNNWVDKNVTGYSAKSDRDWYRFRAMVSDNDRVRGDYRGYNSPGNDKEKFDKKNAQREEESGRIWREKASDAQRAYDKSLAGKAEKAVNDVKNWGDQAGRDVGKAVDDAKQWVGERASDVKKWGDQAGKDVGKAASDVKTWGEQAAKDVGKAAKDAGDWVGERAKDVGNAVGTAAKNVGNWAGTAAKDVARVGGSAFEKGRNFITGLFGKKKKG